MQLVRSFVIYNEKKNFEDWTTKRGVRVFPVKYIFGQKTSHEQVLNLKKIPLFRF